MAKTPEYRKQPYAPRTKYADDFEIAQRVDEVDAAKARGILISLVDCLYGPEADVEWGADTLDAIAQLLALYNLTP
jgi:hypothetical protein